MADTTHSTPPLYLEDMTVGRHLKSGEHAMNSEQIISFARVLHVVSDVTEVNPSRSKPDRGMVTVRSETLNQHGDVLQVSSVRIVVPRRPGAVA